MTAIELIKAIALLCQINSGVQSPGLFSDQIQEQIKCQKYYAKCIEDNQTNLLKCIYERK